ncbi:MAG: 50S ribosomal protein L4 [Propioniciclava sp.]
MSAPTVTILGSDKTAELPADLFDVQTNIPLIHQVVVAQQAAARQGTHSTKTRGQVRGGGAKPWRQKGTGRARQGSRRAPQWTGGGIVHGPQPRDYSKRTPKKMIAAALRGVLSDRAREGRVHVVESFGTDVPSTKTALQALAPVAGRRVLVVLDRNEDVAWLSLRNVATVHLLAQDQLNAYDVVVSDDVVFSAAALDAFIAARSNGKGTAVAPAAAKAPKAAKPAKAKPVKAVVEESADTAPYGAESYRGDTPPDGFDIKGNEQSMKFHTPVSPWYGRTKAEVWFATEAAAEAAGFINAVAKNEEADQ